ncbi:MULTISPECIES: tRNA (adenosine(37)-N6)-threonylcarbamoyltransferase complex dimerization subunit type 1 TsaB [unclassified Frondihabitans]|uniref:tRNA (adenosine(37)-N6)-threonylcarbamoyltransferase complex dimerization subunit type 1 TsaB n=1 Tax=unclassified Frondihabitans TaxID=2626248 RepID=UPI000F4F8D7E|nr:MULTISPECIES: tRNA (adenosine(37)-N6)-threonylcarbamoyltransferase complex dimerization subunit type 1 TsaB [unclassified Frondihabitans]RPE77414.1 tRNA threonylcarbamoyl adenosine modification protein YeaZ [Frondihabitans sp. PhB153]RPF07690.1 tRNA threonylcarbamoyl adenosine modification protein YeaZ [Frondihabitans sp. PhB161]
MLLAIDTSSGTSVAVVDRDGGVLAEVTELDTRRHAEVIGESIAFCLDAAGVAPDELSAVVAGMGPGPFTGLRVGIAAARAFAFGAGKPCLPLISHDAIAFERLGGLARAISGAAPEPAAPLLVITDARRRELYWSAFSGLDGAGLPARLAAPGLARPAEIFDVVAGSCGSAFVAEATRTDPTSTPVSAAALGMLGEVLFAAGRPFARDEPLYLRSPDVTVPGAPKRVS